MIQTSEPVIRSTMHKPRPVKWPSGAITFVPSGYTVDAFFVVYADHEPERGIASGVAERFAKEIGEAIEQSRARMKAEGLI